MNGPMLFIFTQQPIGRGEERPGFSHMLKSRTWRVSFISTLENLTLGWEPHPVIEAIPYENNFLIQEPKRLY